MQRHLPFLLVGAAAACGLTTVSETPLRGPAPTAILVLPPIDRTGGRTELASLQQGLDGALRDRGYRALPLDVGSDLARRFGWPTGQEPGPGELLRLGAAAGVDAFLELEVDDWQSDGERWLERANWDLCWRLVAATDGALLWEHRDRGSWRRPPPGDAPSLADRDGEPRPVTIGGARATTFRTARELAQWLHRGAMARLPRRS